MKTKLLALTLLVLLSSLAVAADAKPLPKCHRLMTEAECGEHLAMLASLPPGEAQDRYLDEFARTKKEREAACSCTHGMARREPAARQYQAFLAY